MTSQVTQELFIRVEYERERGRGGFTIRQTNIELQQRRKSK